MEYSKFRNKNRGYMKLEVWHKAIELFKLVSRIVYAEHEYIQFLYVALGSLGETLTRSIGLQVVAESQVNNSTRSMFCIMKLKTS